MTTTRTCVPEFVIRWLESYKKSWRQAEGCGPFDVIAGVSSEENSWFAILFGQVNGYSGFYPRCKMAYNHPDMRQILEM